MRIEELDRNLKVDCGIEEPDIVWFDAMQPPFAIYGLRYDKEQGCFIRMPQAVADTVNPGVAYLCHHTAGGRLRFCTDSSFIGLHAVMKNDAMMPHFTLAGQSGFDLYRSQNGEQECYVATFMPPIGMKEGYSASCKLNGAMAAYTINFPLYDRVEHLYIALKRRADLKAPEPYRNEKPVVYYGSSITQGGCASRPGNSYQAILSRRLGIDYINLGFSGSARAEESMAAYLASLPMSVFVCDYDHNTPSAEHLAATHWPLYRAVREAQPNLPILFLSAPDVLRDPAAFAPRREIIRETYRRAREAGDDRVYLVEGDTLFAGEDADSCTVDGCHPNDLGFYRMARAVEPVLAKLI